MKILLVGGANGIGKNAAKYLRDKNQVTVIDRDREALEKLEKVDKIHLDITE